MQILIVSVVFISFTFSVNSEDELELNIKPEKCYGTDDLLERRCCVFPPFFNRVVARECGGKAAVVFFNRESNITGFRRGSIKPCEHWKCLLEKYRILDSDGYVSMEKYFDHLDKWVKLNPAFHAVMLNAKSHCKRRFRIFMPLTTCEFFDFQGCIRNFVNLDCPAVIPIPECREWKEFYDECREYFL